MRTGTTGSSWGSVWVLRAEVQQCWRPVPYHHIPSRACQVVVMSLRGIFGCLFLCIQGSSSCPQVLKAGVSAECPTCVFTPSHNTNVFNPVLPSPLQFLLATTKISKLGNIWSGLRHPRNKLSYLVWVDTWHAKLSWLTFSLQILFESTVLCSVQYYCKNIFQTNGLKQFLKCRNSIYYIENINCKKACNAFSSL